MVFVAEQTFGEFFDLLKVDFLDHHKLLAFLLELVLLPLDLGEGVHEHVFVFVFEDL